MLGDMFRSLVGILNLVDNTICNWFYQLNCNVGGAFSMGAKEGFCFIILIVGAFVTVALEGKRRKRRGY